MQPLLVLLALLLVPLPSPARAQRAPFAIPDPDPEVERRSFIVADGFEVNLYAADPLLAKPIQMNFDPQGRLWVASSEVYPQIQPGQKANDKVLVLEDADGDGKAEKTSVFADGLLIPTGIEPGDGGAYVANSTELLHLKDTDGDGKADARRVVLAGFGTEDTHHIIHSLRWGQDGQLYFNQSIYIHSHIETPLGVRRLGGGGIWELRPETLELDVFIRGLVNPWGHHFNRWGQNFATDGAGGEGINYALPGAYYFTAVDAVRILPGLNPGSPKHCGLEVASGRHLPESWRGSLLTNDFRGNRVCRFVVSDDGAGFASREQPEVLKTSHVAFRPIDIKMGPDGAIYIADWYNPIIQHGEVDFRDPRRDHARGRIWRVTARGRPLVPRPKLVGASVEDLLEALKAPEDWTRQQAKRVLKERGAEAVVHALAEWVKALDPNDPEFEHQRLEALWTYQGLDVAEPELLATLLRSVNPDVRGAATRIVGYWRDRLSDPLALLSERVADDHPRVRLEASRALAKLGTAKAAAVALRAIDRPVDRFLDYALWLTARQLAPAWLPELKAGRFDFEGNPARLVFALQAVGTGEVVGPLLAALRDGAIPEAQEQGALTLAATLGRPTDLAAIFDLAMKDGDLPAPRRAALLDGLATAARQRRVRPSGDLGRAVALLDAKDPLLGSAAARLAGAWKLEAVRERLEAAALSSESTPALRDASIEALAALGSAEARDALRRLTGKEVSRDVQRAALLALAGLDPAASAGPAVAWLANSTDPADAEAVVARFAKLRGGPAALAKALAGAKVSPDAVKLALRAARASGPEDPALVQALRNAGGLGDSPRPLGGEEKLALLTDVSAKGDARRGEAVFRRSENQCLKCHAIAGAGGQVGPGLESIGASAPVDYLLDSMLEPGKAIKENYHSLVVATTDGQIVNGIKVRQTDRELVLRDAEDREVAIPFSTIEEQKQGGSLMPVGLTESLTRAELVDLVRFLSEMGKIGPYSVGKARVVRRWRVLEPTQASHTEIRRWGLQTVAAVGNRYTDLNGRGGGTLTWSPAYSQVSGVLPLDSLPTFQLGPIPGAEAAVGATAFVRFQLDVSTPGPVQLTLNDAKGLTIWVDGTTVEPRRELVVDLAPGVHVVTMGVNLSGRRDGLGVTLDDVPGSPARAQLILGK